MLSINLVDLYKRINNTLYSRKIVTHHPYMSSLSYHSNNHTAMC